MEIDDFVSPSDQKLIELAGGLTEDLGIVLEIFKDRNPSDVVTSFAIGQVATIIYRVCNISVNLTDFVKFLAEQAQKEEEGDV